MTNQSVDADLEPAVALLKERGLRYEAGALATGDLDVWTERRRDEGLCALDEDLAEYYAKEFTCATITVPYSAYVCLTDTEEDWAPVCAAIKEALPGLDEFWVEPGDDDTRSTWQGLRFRSQAERRIAEAFDRADVLYAANALVRVGVTADHRETREPGFVVLHDGKVGMLEVDGPSHSGRAADDHERDRRFREHGVRVVERFTAEECCLMPDDVVARFLRLLRLNG